MVRAYFRDLVINLSSNPSCPLYSYARSFDSFVTVTMAARVKEDISSIQADVSAFLSGLSSSAPDDEADFNDPGFRKSERSSSSMSHRKHKRERSPPAAKSMPKKSSRNATGSFPADNRRWGEKRRDANESSFSHHWNPSASKKSNVKLKESKLGSEVIGEDKKDDGFKLFSKVWSLLDSAPWFEVTQSLFTAAQNKDKEKLKTPLNTEEWADLVSRAQNKGEELMEKAALEYDRTRGKNSDIRWLMVARKSGTTVDKVAAFTVLLQDNPVANLKSLDALLGMVTSKGGKRHAAMGIDALKELFITRLLPDQKLKYLIQQPLQHIEINTHEGQRLLLLWYWEDCLKHRYDKFVSSLDEAAKDNLPYLKEKALKTIYELLKSKPEQERKLLSAIVNKLGDPERKVASNAGYYLSCLLSTHPNMKMVVIDEVDSFLFRPHLSLCSKYQASIFLNQTVLSHKGDGPKLARRLIDIYFSLFKVITVSQSENVKEKDTRKKIKNGKLTKETDHVVEVDSRLLSALLTGVNRAFPYVAVDDVDSLVEEHAPVLFRLVHSKSFNVGVQALMLLYQLLAKNNTVSDRLYRAMYAVLLSPVLFKSTKLDMFLSLVFKVIKSDISSKRMAAFSKRLMQVALQGAPQFACGCLLLLSEVLKIRPMLWHAITQPEEGDDEIEHFEDVDDETVDDEVDHIQGVSEERAAVKDCSNDKSREGGHYNMHHRDPSFCNADKTCWWELTTLASHGHPSVAAMAKTILSGASILYSGDPLRDLALGVFLDRFSEKKPKSQRKTETWHGPLSIPTRKASNQSNILPSGSEFLQLTAGEVAPEDVAFYKFYTAKLNKKGQSKKEKKVREESILNNGKDSLTGDDSEEDEIDDLLEEEEGVEMGLDDITDDEDDSEGEWVLKGDGRDEGDSMSEDISGDDIPAPGDVNENYDSDNVGSKELESSKGASKRNSKKKRKQSKVRMKGQKKKIISDESKKSPFASFEDYSHMFDDGNLNGAIVPSAKKRRSSKS